MKNISGKEDTNTFQELVFHFKIYCKQKYYCCQNKFVKILTNLELLTKQKKNTTARPSQMLNEQSQSFSN